MNTVISLQVVQETHKQAAREEVTHIVYEAFSEAFNAAIQACIRHRWPNDLAAINDLFLSTLRGVLEAMERYSVGNNAMRRVGNPADIEVGSP